jgi:CheY-like chemotaxis protein
LVADDHALVTIMLTHLLTVTGVRVAVAQTAAEVIEKASALRPALLLVDMQLPTVDGATILRALRRDVQLQRTPIIAMSAIHWLGYEMHYLEAGASAYICKPIGVKQLDDLIQQWLPITHG